MSSGVSLIIRSDAPLLVPSRLAAYVELTRPRLTVMVLVTVAVGFSLACASVLDPARLLLSRLHPPR
jgi:heme O synthase-like polyprenyltransferase